MGAASGVFCPLKRVQFGELCRDEAERDHMEMSSMWMAKTKKISVLFTLEKYICHLLSSN